MSGGYFDYKQYQIEYMIEKLERGVACTSWFDRYSRPTIDRVMLAVFYLKLSQIYVNNIDLLLSGDSSEERFMDALKQDLEAFYKEESRLKEHKSAE